MNSFYSEKMQTLKTKMSSDPNSSQRPSQPNSMSVTKKETEFAEIPEEDEAQNADIAQTITDPNTALQTPKIKSQKTQLDKMQRKAEEEKRKQQEKDQLELCGEEFITGIH